jgi:hypothetical protein
VPAHATRAAGGAAERDSASEQLDPECAVRFESLKSAAAAAAPRQYNSQR